MGDGLMDVSREVIARPAGDLAAAGGVRSVVLGDGAERGIRVLEFRTGGGLRFDVLVDRAMDIGLAESGSRGRFQLRRSPGISIPVTDSPVISASATAYDTEWTIVPE
jgi:hypothetical protein